MEMNRYLKHMVNGLLLLGCVAAAGCGPTNPDHTRETNNQGETYQETTKRNVDQSTADRPEKKTEEQSEQSVNQKPRLVYYKMPM